MTADGNAAPDTGDDATGPDGSTLWYAALGHLIDEVVFIHREDRSIAFVSPSVTHVLGYSPSEYTALTTPELIHPDDMPLATEQAISLRAERGSSYRSIIRIRHAEGRWIWAEIVGRNLLHEPSVRGVIQTLRDITERRQLEEELRHLALHDGLTGLANRNHFLDQLDAILQRGDVTLAVLYIDLDGFKAINDTYGHRTGDEILRVVAERLEHATRGGDVCGRLGGDEFVAYFHGVADAQSANAVGRRVFAAINGPAAIGDLTVHARASIGVAVPSPGEDADHVVSRADAALYTAKRAGGGGVVVASPH